MFYRWPQHKPTQAFSLLLANLAVVAIPAKLKSVAVVAAILAKPKNMAAVAAILANLKRNNSRFSGRLSLAVIL
jgi:hypothetical protein